jgi:hypothetical protein
VKRVRGKNIVWLSLIAILFSAMTISVSAPPVGGRIFVDYMGSNRIYNEDLSIPIDGDFTIDINVENAKDLYAFGFTLGFAPYGRTLIVVGVTDGGFLDGEGILTDFNVKTDIFHGRVLVGNTRLGSVPGVSGSGTLASITFRVTDAGSSELNLEDVQLFDSTGALLGAVATHGEYFGPEVKFSDIDFDPGRVVNLNSEATLGIETTVENTAEVPLMVRVKYDFPGDPWRRFYGGQTFRTVAPPPEYLYVNEFIPWLMMWNTYGADPWLDAPDDGNYVEMGPDGTLAGVWGFDDIDLAGRLINRVVLEGYTNAPYDEAIDFDIYSAFDFSWLGSLYGVGEPAWVGVRWTADAVSDVCPWTLEQDGLNGFMVLGYSYHGIGSGEILDCLRLRVEFASVAPVQPPVYELGPGESMTIASTWIVTMDDLGRHVGEATVEFSYSGNSWIPASKVKDFFVWVKG